MKTRIASVLMFFLMPAFAASPGDGYADLVERIQDAVVSIQVTQEVPERTNREQDLFQYFFRDSPQRRGPAPDRAPQSAGTGFIISEDGYIVTNRHVVADASEVEVVLSGDETYEAKVIGTDDSLDVALIKIDAKNLTALEIGDSERMRIGDIVLALGYPLQLGFSVTSGIVSGMGRNMNVNRMDVASYIQTDADITFGNSGGPLVNTKGQVIAINTMIVSRGETYGFSIPSNLFMNSVRQLRETGKVRRGALGVSIGPLDDESKEYYDLDKGALVSSVTRGLPAEKAGIRGGDIILSIDGQDVKGPNDVISNVGNRAPGEKVKLLLFSDGKKVEKVIKLGSRDKLFNPNADADEPEEEVQDPDSTGLGFTAAPLDKETRQKYSLGRRGGVLVTSVDDGSLAQRKGLRRGVVLTHVDRQPVRSMEEVKARITPLKSGQVTSIRIIEPSQDFPDEMRERTLVLRKE